VSVAAFVPPEGESPASLATFGFQVGSLVCPSLRSFHPKANLPRLWPPSVSGLDPSCVRRRVRSTRRRISHVSETLDYRVGVASFKTDSIVVISFVIKQKIPQVNYRFIHPQNQMTIICRIDKFQCVSFRRQKADEISKHYTNAFHRRSARRTQGVTTWTRRAGPS